MLLAVGRHLGRLAGVDLADRARRGRADAGRTARKRGLTAASSSRWAGAITRTSDDQWNAARRNLVRGARDLGAAIERITARLAAPCGERDAVGVRGYAGPGERFHKQRRLQLLAARRREVERRLAGGTLSICRGGTALARTRHNLDAAGLDVPTWRARWEAARLFITADGEKDKRLGNETIRWDPATHSLEIRLPTPLATLANAPGGRYRLTNVRFAYRGDEVAAQTASGAVRYDVNIDPATRRWYLDASWSVARPSAELADLRTTGMLGVDLNAGHLAAWMLDRHGNPVGAPRSIALDLEGLPATQRDGRLRAAISGLIRLAGASGLGAIAVEDLDFTQEKRVSRETHGRGRRGRRFRRMIHGLPTGQFRDRLVQMASNAGLAVVAVDPAYTTRWGIEHWQKPLGRERHEEVSTHHSAAVVIGRRGLGYRATRRGGVTARQPRHAAQSATFQARRSLRGREGTHADGGGREDPRPPTSGTRGTRAPKTVRGAPVEHVRVLTG